MHAVVDTVKQNPMPALLIGAGVAWMIYESRREDTTGMRDEPDAAAPALVESLELEGYHYFHATRAELLRRLDRAGEARAAYDRALALVHSDAERRFLEQRVAELGVEPAR